MGKTFLGNSRNLGFSKRQPTNRTPRYCLKANLNPDVHCCTWHRQLASHPSDKQKSSNAPDMILPSVSAEKVDVRLGPFPPDQRLVSESPADGGQDLHPPPFLVHGGDVHESRHGRIPNLVRRVVGCRVHHCQNPVSHFRQRLRDSLQCPRLS